MPSDSILDYTKACLGLEPDYDVYDTELLIYINAALSTVSQLGIGPKYGFTITGNEQTWLQFMGPDPRLNNVQQFVYLSVKIIFDPPDNQAVLSALQTVRDETMFRVNIEHEEAISNPEAVYLSTPDDAVVVDGGELANVPAEDVLDGGTI